MRFAEGTEGLARRVGRRLAALATASVMAVAGVAVTGHLATTRVRADATFDQTLFSLINQDRAQNGVGPLRWNQTLAGIAESSPSTCPATVGGRAQDMIARNYFAHTIPGCSLINIFGILQALGIGYSWAGENIGWESGLNDPVAAAQMLNTAFMNSPGHRANILNPNYTDVGVGSASTAPGQSWTGAGSALQNVTMTAENFAGNPTSPPPTAAPVPPSVNGYWLAGGNGAVFDFGAPGDFGSLLGRPLNQPIVGMAVTPSGNGYWLVARDGGTFTFGDAVGYGSAGGIHLNQPIVGMAATHSGRGYWLVAADGGIFPFGDAAQHSYGSTGGMHLNRPIVGMAATPSGNGYWVVSSDGGVFPFGDAQHHSYGSTGGIHLNQPIVGMGPTPAGDGYWLVARDGGMFPFGDAGGYGSTGGMVLNQPIVGMAATHSGHGYWLVAADGGIFPFGDAHGLGSAGAYHLSAPIVGMSGG